MSIPDDAKQFTGSVPQLYEQLLVPMIFASYARDLALRAQARPGVDLLEIAAGTGAVTRELAERLPGTTSIVATDLNQPMLDRAARIGTARPVTWQQADAMHLPFSDATFDTVVCQFGVMFFPDRVHAYAQARRVLRSGGVFIFNVWDRIEANEFADTVQRALIDLYSEDPPRFLARIPYGYFDSQVIRDDLARGGFHLPAVITNIAARSRADSARAVAEGYCQGTPMRAALDSRGPGELKRATEAAEAALVRRFGTGEIEADIRALVIEISA